MAAHESQSLIVEMQACRSDAFLRWLGPELHAAFGGDPAAVSTGQSRPALAADRARLHPRRCRRDDLSGARHPALPAGAGADRGRRSRWRICRAHGTKGCRRCSASRRRTMRAAACRTSIGTMARSAISRATRWARWRRRSSWRRRGAMCPNWTRRWAGRSVAAARLAARQGAWPRAACSEFNDLLRAATGKPLDPADFEAHLTARYLQ